MFIPSKPRKGCRRREGSRNRRSTCSPTAAELIYPSPASNPGTVPVTINQHSPQDIPAEHNEAPDVNQKVHGHYKRSSGSAEAQCPELSQEALHKQQTLSRSFAYEGRKRENRKVHFDEIPAQISQSSQEDNSADGPLHLHSCPPSQGEMEANREKSLVELNLRAEPCGKTCLKAGRDVSSLSQADVAKDVAGIEIQAGSSEQEKQVESRELSRRASHPCILPRPPVLPGIHTADKVGSVGGESPAFSLLDLQNSYSKSTAHRNFNNSTTRAAVDLRDNVVAGRKHEFYGINCYYLRG